MTDRASRGEIATAVAVSLGCAALVVFSTRVAPQLSPDSVTYLAAADHLRHGDGLLDFTGEPLAVFPPAYPLLLTPGGTSLGWVRAVGAAAVAGAAFLMWALLRRRVRPSVALVAAGVLGASQGLVRVASTAWSEAPYMVIALATLLVLGRREVSTRRAALAGGLAGLAFLTRYAGAGLVLTGLVVLLMACIRPVGERSPGAWRAMAAYVAVSFTVSGAWIVRNLVRTGTAMGPRFEGGATDSPTVLLRRPLLAIGRLVVGERPSSAVTQLIGLTVVAALGVGAIALIVGAVRHGWATHPLDVGMAVFGVTSFAVPVLARAVTSSDIESRVMSPMVLPIVYGAAVAVDHWWPRRWLRVAGVAIAVAAVVHGLVVAEGFPDHADLSTGSRELFSPALYDAVDELPESVTVVTNFPQGLWWQTRRDPTLFAFTRPRAGNSHVPLTLEETVDLACHEPAHLAWFSGLLNAGEGPAERRPDLVAAVDLVPEREVPGGVLYRLRVRDRDDCATAG